MKPPINTPSYKPKTTNTNTKMASQNPKPAPTRHIAVLAFPFGTHAAPLLRLVGALSAAAGSGSGVRFSFFCTARSNDALFGGAEGIGDVRRCDVGDGWPEGRVPTGNPIELVEMFLRATPGNFAAAMEAAESEAGARFACVVSDAFFWFAGDLAAERGVPWVPLWTAAPRSLLVHLATEEIQRRLGGEGLSSTKDEQTLHFLPGFSAIRVSDLPEGVVTSSDHGDDQPFPNMLHRMGQSLHKATAVLINSFREIDPEISDILGARLRNFLNIGPFTLTMQPPQPASSAAPAGDENGCLEWLSKHEAGSVVYLSFGSVVTPPPHEVAALAEALEETGLPFLWSFRGPRPGRLLEGESGGRRRLVPWAPQVEVLKHPAVGAFVTHCGWNSVLESVAGGVPLVCRPFFGDQMLNMRTVEAVWRVGVGVVGEGGSVTKEGYVKALRRVMLDEEGKGMRERIGVLKRLAYEAVGDDHDQASGVNNSTQDFKALVDLVMTI